MRATRRGRARSVWSMRVALASTLTVPVSDIDRALGLYRDCLGFIATHDSGGGTGRVVMLTAPGGVLSIRLQAGTHEEPAGSLREAVLPVRDLAGTLGCLHWSGISEHWVDPDAPGGPAALFADEDGNVWTLWQAAAEARRAA